MEKDAAELARLTQRLERLVEAPEDLGAELARRSVDPAAVVDGRALAEVGRELLGLHRMAGHDAEGLHVHDEAGRRALDPARDHRLVGEPVVGGVDLDRGEALRVVAQPGLGRLDLLRVPVLRQGLVGPRARADADRGAQAANASEAALRGAAGGPGPVDGERELVLPARDGPAAAGRGEPVAEAQAREALADLLLVGLGRVRASAVELHVARVEERIGLLQPRHEVVADARADVEDDRRGPRDAGLGAGGQHLVQALLVVGQPGEDGRDEHAGADARVSEAPQDLEAACGPAASLARRRGGRPRPASRCSWRRSVRPRSCSRR